tara:strand:- start:1064 stop:1819 length:756 start_codon:yes stop_codon:yes gene_type:complete
MVEHGLNPPVQDPDAVSTGDHASAVFPVTITASFADRSLFLRLLRLVGTGLMLASTLAGYANDGAPFFDLPAQPLPLSLETFSEQTGISILVTSDRIQDKTASAVRGHFPPDQALTILLNGTGLTSRRLTDSALTLIPAQHDDAKTVASKTRSVVPPAYARSLQQSVLTGLCRHQPEQLGQFRLVVQLWANPQGRVTRVHFPDGDAEARWGTSVRASFKDLILPPPPPGMPQPITLLLHPGTPSCQGESRE